MSGAGPVFLNRGYAGSSVFGLMFSSRKLTIASQNHDSIRMNPNCASCHFLMQSHDNRPICRVNGLEASPTNAEDCKRYMRETASDDEKLVWFNQAWVLECEARN